MHPDDRISAAAGPPLPGELLLTPRSLLRALSPRSRWRFDAPLLGGRWRLHDVYATDDRRLLVELREGESTLRLAVTPDTGAGEPATLRARGLAVSWIRPGPRDAGAAACHALARSLSAGPPSPRWRIPRDASLAIPEAIATIEEERGLVRDPDHALLARDAAHYASLFGGQPRARRVGIAGAWAPGSSIHFPRPLRASPPSGSLYEVPRSLVRRDLRGYFALLGCAYGDGVPRTVPTPTTFLRAMETLGLRPPLSPRLLRGRRGSLSGRAWIGAVVAGVLPIAVAPIWAVGVHRALRKMRILCEIEQIMAIPVDVGMLAHDMSLHALGLHRLPGDRWEALTRVAGERLHRGGRRVFSQVASFFEGDLTRAAWEVWGEVESPAAFAPAFDRRIDGLLRRLQA